MDELLTTLERVMRDEVSAYTVLVNRLPFKTALIRKNRVDQLEYMTRQEEEELKRLTDLERARLEVVQQLLPAMGTGAEPTLSALLPALAPEWQAKLQPLGDRLKELAVALRKGNETCQILLKASLEYIDFTMQLVGNAVANAQPTLYGDGMAEPDANSPSLLLDRRA
ncbi:MAG TPA: flagellar protein FlgN [Stenomitos sp.]